MDEKGLVLQQKVGRYQKEDRLLQWLMFLGGVAIAGLSVAVDLPGGLFADKLVSIVFRFFTIAVLFYLLAFRGNVARFALNHTSWWELLLAGSFSVYQGVAIWQSFSNVYLKSIVKGEAPSIAQRVYDAIPGADALKLPLLYGALFVATLIATFGFFILSVCVVRLLKESFKSIGHQLDYPDYEPTLSLGKRMLIGTALACVTALFCFMTLDKGQGWGADYTVYLSQAQQLATGQTAGINVVWGYGAMLAPIYQLFGYDRVDFSSLIYYKIPAALCLTILTFVLFLFYSKRFQALYAAALTMAFGLSPLFITFTNEILTNLPHMLFSTLSVLFLYELFEERKLGKQIAFAILAGISIGIADLIRVNGIILLLALGCTHLICLINWLLRKHRYFGDFYRRLPIRHIGVHALPYVGYFLFTAVINLVVFSRGGGIGVQAGGATAGAQALANAVQSGTIQGVSFDWVLDSIRYYWGFLTGFIYDLTPFNTFRAQIAFVALPLLAIGLVQSFRKELISVIYLFGTVAMLCLIAFRQGVLYVFPVLPMVLLLFAVGLQTFYRTAVLSMKQPRLLQGMLRTLAVLVCVSLLIGSTYFSVKNLQNHRVYDLYSYSEDAKDVYRYIQNNTASDAEIVFVKPGVVALNTERAASGGIPVNILHETYLLITSEPPREHQLIDPEEYGSIENLAKQTGCQFELTYQNPRFDLYRITK